MPGFFVFKSQYWSSLSYVISLNDNTTPQASVDIVGLVEQIFASDGYLVSRNGLEYRPQQEIMAIKTAQSFTTDTSLLFEAGTGTGKSLAYLVPGIIKAVSQQRPLVISSHTIALQEQLQKKDLEHCRALFESIPELKAFAGFKTALLVGRGNYLCTTRLQRAIEQIGSMAVDSESQELQRIAAWAQSSKTGLRHELTPPVTPDIWDMVSAESSTCSRTNCSPEVCFYQKAKKEVLSSDIRIVNHSLLFALLNAGMSAPADQKGILFAEDSVVLDEAHTVPDIATEHFGNAISSYAVSLALNRLYNPTKDRGFLKKHGDPRTLDLASHAILAADNYFNEIHVRFLDERSIARLHEPHWSPIDELLPIARLVDALGTLENRIQDERQIPELKDHRKRLFSLYQGLIACNEFKADDHVYWVERSGKRGTNTQVRSAPIHVAPYLRDYLFNGETSLLLTSATLSAGKRLDRFASKVGGDGSESQRVDSPFDYETNCTVQVFRQPLIERNDGRNERSLSQIDTLSDQIIHWAEQTNGGVLVLFTSYAELQKATQSCEFPIERMGRELFVQGKDLSRTDMVAAFKNAGNAVMFGTDSFWTGIDIPGPALEHLIITRLPFENPSHPIHEARVEWIQKQGGNPFMEMIVPDALIKFRQGLGRLIRNQSDTGTITILDNRILTKPYGKYFLAALPKKTYEVYG